MNKWLFGILMNVKNWKIIKIGENLGFDCGKDLELKGDRKKVTSRVLLRKLKIAMSFIKVQKRKRSEKLLYCDSLHTDYTLA